MEKKNGNNSSQPENQLVKKRSPRAHERRGRGERSKKSKVAGGYAKADGPRQILSEETGRKKKPKKKNHEEQCAKPGREGLRL